MHTCMRAIRIHHVYIYAYICIRIYIYIHIHIFVLPRTHTHAHTHTHTYAHIYAYIHTHTHAHTHIHTHTHTHTHTRIRSFSTAIILRVHVCVYTFKTVKIYEIHVCVWVYSSSLCTWGRIACGHGCYSFDHTQIEPGKKISSIHTSVAGGRMILQCVSALGTRAHDFDLALSSLAGILMCICICAIQR